MNHPPTPGNNVWFGDDSRDNAGIGGNNYGAGRDNYGTIQYGGMPQPTHHFEVVDRMRTPVTDRGMLLLTIIMTVTSLGSFALMVAQAYGPVSAEGLFLGLARLGYAPSLLLAGGILAGGLALWLGDRRAWLRRRTYSHKSFGGRLPEGRADGGNRTRLYLTRVKGICGVDGSPMRLVNRPTKETSFTRSDGSSGVKPSHYQAHLVCGQVPGSDRHMATIDPSDTDPPDDGQGPSTSSKP